MKMKSEMWLAMALLSVCIVGTADAVRAGDDGLYEKQLDPNMAFVRVVMPGTNNATIMGKSLNLEADGVSAYLPVSPGAIAVSTGMGDVTVETVAGKFYSVLPGNGKPAGVEDELNTNPAKAVLSVYNLTAGNDVDIFVPQAKVEAIADASSNASKSVALKAPLTLDLVVRSDGKDVKKIDAVEFKRLAGVSIIVTGSGDSIEAVALPNKIAR